MRAFGMVLALIAAGSARAETAAGGLVLSTANLGSIGPVQAGVLPCIGGAGLALDGHERLGGEGQYCADGDATFAFAGGRWGRQRDLAFGYWGFDLEAGGGWADAADADGRFRGAFAYGRPALVAGVPVGFGAVEGGLYAMLPVPLVQSLGGDAAPQGTFASAGVQVTVLFGNFWDRKDRSPESVGEIGEADVDEIVPGPVAEIPLAQEPAPPAPAARGVVYEEDSRPLAIPQPQPSPR